MAVGESVALAELPPGRGEEIAALLIFKYHMEFVDEDMRAPAALPVERDTVEHRVRNDQQSCGLELLAEIMDVEYHHALIQIHISGMAENVQRTGRIEALARAQCPAPLLPAAPAAFRAAPRALG